MLKALYVDDEEDIATIVEICLDLDGGFETRFARSGSDALETAVSWRPDIILLDYMMPEMDGPTTFSHLKANEKTAHIPVAFITAKSMRDDVSRLLDMGAVSVISKPFDPQTLANDIRQAHQSSKPSAS